MIEEYCKYEDCKYKDFSPNKIPIEVITEGAFERTCFRGIYSGVNEKWYKSLWKEFVQLKNIDAKFYSSDYYDKNLNKYKVKKEHRQDFGKIKVG